MSQREQQRQKKSKVNTTVSGKTFQLMNKNLVDIPTFHGDIEQWEVFYQVFRIMAEEDDNIPKVNQKMVKRQIEHGYSSYGFSTMSSTSKHNRCCKKWQGNVEEELKRNETVGNSSWCTILGSAHTQSFDPNIRKKEETRGIPYGVKKAIKKIFSQKRFPKVN
ncbi:hypothetical protein GCK72_011172 [Caenorhabditis remanei]|uniref:Uncharacterized protein n=1 Tax=Caenorhabditis remanei TaxID=31234 RepID=A0A6A5H599_CAERE|nr:hypothetical protein GCK72_011172 [Caenorhabditis remanei]KAF1762908.1 hypothetical protein GCK72_011172 [Caenorhabditis remanei]